MTKIVWLVSFETGFPEIDNDHRGLVQSIGLIEEALNADDIESCLIKINNFLKLAADHFIREEAFLISIDFPRLKSHRIAHKRLLKMAGDIVKTLKSGLNPDAIKKCLEELVYFLLEDVIKADAEFKSYAQEKGFI
jgi:hemerythrin